MCRVFVVFNPKVKRLYISSHALVTCKCILTLLYVYTFTFTLLYYAHGIFIEHIYYIFIVCFTD